MPVGSILAIGTLLALQPPELKERIRSISKMAEDKRRTTHQGRRQPNNRLVRKTERDLLEQRAQLQLSLESGCELVERGTLPDAQRSVVCGPF